MPPDLQQPQRPEEARCIGHLESLHPGGSQGAQGSGGRPPEKRVRRLGGGRKKLVDRDPDLLAALEGLVDLVARGDPQSPLRCICKSLKQLARELGEQGHRISHVSAGILLKELGYGLQDNRKTRKALITRIGMPNSNIFRKRRCRHWMQDNP